MNPMIPVVSKTLKFHRCFEPVFIVSIYRNTSVGEFQAHHMSVGN
jgi:hypothetical protein